MINERLSNIETKDQSVISEVVKTEIQKALESRHVAGMSEALADDQDRTKQVLVKGFGNDTDADKIIATIEEISATGSRRDKVTSVSTFTDPSSFGVVTFTTMAAKIGFYKKMKDVNTKMDNDRYLKFEDNVTWDQRICHKTMGQIKYHLHETGGHALHDIKIDRRHNLVKIKGKRSLQQSTQMVYNSARMLSNLSKQKLSGT